MAKRPIGNRNAKFRPATKTKILPNKSGIKKRLTLSKSNVQDARQKIIQKKRKTVVDARDILAKMAKTQDARSKINKLRETRSGAPRANGNVKAIGSNILQKTDRNGKISLVTNKTKHASDMNLAIQKQLGLVSTPRSPPKKVVQKRNAAINTHSHTNLPIRKTILNDLDFSSPLTDSMNRMYDGNVYKWTKQDMRGPTTASQMINELESRRQAMRDDLLLNHWHNYPVTKPLRLGPTAFVDLDAVEDEEMPYFPPRQTISLQGSSRTSNIHSRLDNVPPTPESHGILSQTTKTKVVVPVGHRIVVSNLQSTVTQDDIKELFEDIGQLLAARLVRPGVAEVIYKNLKDAQKAVDTYHNRQLDGQPMKCLLVNKRPLNQPTAPPISKSESQGILARKSVASSSANTLVPDITTIHKVLFQRK